MARQEQSGDRGTGSIRFGCENIRGQQDQPAPDRQPKIRHVDIRIWSSREIRTSGLHAISSDRFSIRLPLQIPGTGKKIPFLFNSPNPLPMQLVHRAASPLMVSGRDNLPVFPIAGFQD
jgi:hypothetical protein